MLNKYPVISENGNTYLVSIWEDNHGFYVVDIYVEKVGLFGKKKFKQVNGGFYENYYEIEKWNYDLVTMAQHEVRKYEKKIASQIRHQKKLNNAFKEFKEWDGVIKS